LSSHDQGGRTRAPRAPRPRSTASGRTAGVDDRTLLIRRGVAAVAGLLLVVVLGLLIRSYLNGRRDAALRSYDQKVSTIATEEAQISAQLFKLLADAANTGQPTAGDDVNAFRVQAQLEASDARGLSVPGQMAGAQQNLLLALDLRDEALQTIANKIPDALGTDSAATAIDVIAAQMQGFLASDVIYAQRVVPLITEALAGQHIEDETVSTSRFLPDLGWLNPDLVTQRMLGITPGTTATGAPTPGSHGDAMLSVSLNGAALQQNSVVNPIKLSPTPTFSVLVANQGDNDETGVVVEIEIEGGSGSPLISSTTIDTKSQTVSPPVLIPLNGSPPVGVTLKLVGKVLQVPGETNLSNNSKTYLVDFSK
jgi:hypothetical protein